jgi:hypothetical protein
MSSLASILTVTKKLYFYKLKAHAGFLFILACLQIFALVFAFLGMAGGMSTHGGSIRIDVTIYSAVGILVFTMFWAFVVSIYLASKALRNLDFAFVGNRLSSNLANFCLLATFSVLGGLCASLSTLVLRNVIYFMGRGPYLLGEYFYLPPGELLMGTIAAILYLLLISALGYFFGSLSSLSKVMVVFIPAILLGTLIMETRTADLSIIIQAIKFFTAEASFAAFIVKSLLTVVVLMLGSALISRRLEVR